MQTNGSDHAKWHLFHQVAGNWVDSIVSDSLDLVNAGPGTYYFDAWIGNNCRSAPLSYKLEAISVKLDTSAIVRNNPSCGKFNGSGGTEQPAGTYMWMMNCPDLLGKKQQLSGSLVLIR